MAGTVGLVTIRMHLLTTHSKHTHSVMDQPGQSASERHCILEVIGIVRARNGIHHYTRLSDMEAKANSPQNSNDQ